MEVSAESEVCALLHMLEQVRRHLSDFVAAPAGPESVEHAHNGIGPQNPQKAEEDVERYHGSHVARGVEGAGQVGLLHPKTSKEISFSGTVTGWDLCTHAVIVCGWNKCRRRRAWQCCHRPGVSRDSQSRGGGCVQVLVLVGLRTCRPSSFRLYDGFHIRSSMGQPIGLLYQSRTFMWSTPVARFV